MSQPDMSDMGAILAQAQQMQEQLEAAQQEIINTTVVGEAPGGLVKVTMAGSGEVHDIAIDPKVVDPDDVETLQDLVVGALGEAARKVSELAEEKMGPLSQGFGGGADGMPGLGF